jgi:hypothetical protein
MPAAVPLPSTSGPGVPVAPPSTSMPEVQSSGAAAGVSGLEVPQAAAAPDPELPAWLAQQVPAASASPAQVCTTVCCHLACLLCAFLAGEMFDNLISEQSMLCFFFWSGGGVRRRAGRHPQLSSTCKLQLGGVCTASACFPLAHLSCFMPAYETKSATFDALTPTAK